MAFPVNLTGLPERSDRPPVALRLDVGGAGDRGRRTSQRHEYERVVLSAALDDACLPSPLRASRVDAAALKLDDVGGILGCGHALDQQHGIERRLRTDMGRR